MTWYYAVTKKTMEARYIYASNADEAQGECDYSNLYLLGEYLMPESNLIEVSIQHPKGKVVSHA